MARAEFLPRSDSDRDSTTSQPEPENEMSPPPSEAGEKTKNTPEISDQISRLIVKFYNGVQELDRLKEIAKDDSLYGTSNVNRDEIIACVDATIPKDEIDGLARGGHYFPPELLAVMAKFTALCEEVSEIVENTREAESEPVSKADRPPPRKFKSSTTSSSRPLPRPPAP